MQLITIIIFWSSLAIVFYTYLGYGILISILSKLKNSKVISRNTVSYLPDITILIAAYNEAAIIEEKILNTLSLNYPSDRLKIFIVTDGSNDGTPEIVNKFPQVKLFHQSIRQGKNNAVNRVMKEVKSPIVVLSDANTIINKHGLEIMVKHFADPHVGGVAGEKRIINKKKDCASGSGEGLYWKYESYLKEKDSEVHSVQGAAGEFFSIRTALYEPPPQNIIIEDFYLSMRIISRGFRFVYEPKAFATETASASVSEEWKRTVRISAGGLHVITKLSYMLNPFRYGIISFQYFSHRVLRWTLAPLSLLSAIITNIVLVSIYDISFYIGFLQMQLLLYALAVLGFFVRNKKMPVKGFFVPFYFAMMNLAVYAGFIKILLGKQSVLWEKARRA